tara:strand:- start:295 stop:408 length:114 start_codon:yes stop_codon:yes gene_type:complete
LVVEAVVVQQQMRALLVLQLLLLGLLGVVGLAVKEEI